MSDLNDECPENCPWSLESEYADHREQNAALFEAMAKHIRRGGGLLVRFTALADGASSEADEICKRWEYLNVNNAINQANIERDAVAEIGRSSPFKMWPNEYYGHCIEMTVKIYESDLIQGPTAEARDIEKDRWYVSDVGWQLKKAF